MKRLDFSNQNSYFQFLIHLIICLGLMEQLTDFCCLDIVEGQYIRISILSHNF